MANTDSLTEEDVHVIAEAIADVRDNLTTLRAQQESVADQVSQHLNKVVEAINDVKVTVEAETYDVDPSVPLVTPKLVPLIKVKMQAQVMET